MLPILIPLLTGCSTTSLFLGVKEPDLTMLPHAENRREVERILGKRLWNAGSADGLTYDVYQFDVAKPAKPLEGLEMLRWEAIFLIPEIDAFFSTKCEPAKQVAVTYDEEDGVHFVSRPWLAEGCGPQRRMRSGLPADSGVPEGACLLSKLRAGSVQKATTLQWPRLPAGYGFRNVIIDGRTTEGHMLELSPGHHTITATIKINHGDHHTATFTDIELLSGRSYNLEWLHIHWVGDRDGNYHTHTFNDLDRRSYNSKWSSIFWIEDRDSMEALACERGDL
jgi:hypothetical protein